MFGFSPAVAGTTTGPRVMTALNRIAPRLMLVTASLAMTVLACAPATVRAAPTVTLFNNFNTGVVFNGPRFATTFVLSHPAIVTSLETYHWNFGHGARPGRIGLRDAHGRQFGPFAAVGIPGQGGAPNVNWVANATFRVPAGTYTVVDSHPATWSNNLQSLFRGFALVRGQFLGPPPPQPGTGCPGGNTGPSVRYGSLNLSPTVGIVNTTSIVRKGLFVTMSGAPDIQLDRGGPMIGPDFELCIVTNPPAPHTHLGVHVSGILLDPSPALGVTGPVAFWQTVFSTFFLGPLQNQQTDAQGVLKVDVPAINLRNAISNAPPGFPSGTMLFTILLSDGPHMLELTLAPQ